MHVLLLYGLALLIRAREHRDRETLLRLILLAAILPTLKLSAVPALLLIPLGLWLGERRTRSSVGAVILVSVLCLLPFVARSAVLTGYPAYPAPLPPIPGLDWAVHPADAAAMRLEVRGWAIEPWAGPAAAARPLREWFGPWLSRGIQRHPVELAALGLGIVAWLLLAVRRRREGLFGLVPLVGVAYWFASAPDVRFGYGWIVALLVVSLGGLAAGRVRAGAPVAVLVPLALGWSALCVAVWTHRAPAWILPEPLPTTEVRSVQVPSRTGALHVWMPVTGDQAWDAPLPNTPLISEGLELRTGRLRDGFRIAR